MLDEKLIRVCAVPCNSIPTISLVFGGKPFDISPDTFNLGPVSSGSSDCVGGIVRVGHGYGKTHGFGVTGVTGTGTGWAFGNPRHTATCTRGIAGMYGYHYHR
jgi:hypothetical protein